ncbi:armadillo repeat-containing protein 6 isoform X2 [Rana temporaria]|nr:armadillo repeat-containing protein 6 isoform X2 [Rana temporaria]XP_040176785.1 armadillo repeat-containing protein 6 isoform X2 [Rana temporaria]XP_040176794.1 armadillo repeat-containing protein 6 isoform X2 [Rana temporaria]XP_040176803.1 armadillo repeat-containing protein 6 isoform X2 [Rana temporaria]
MACKWITQETFDAVVQENMVEFDMEAEEALNEAIQQFASQGVDLTNIIKEVRKQSDEGEAASGHEILQTLDSLRKAVDSGSAGSFSEILIQFGDQCKKGMGHRYLAGQKFAYPVVLEAWKLSENDREALLNALYALSSLTDGQPDLLEGVGQDLLIRNLENYTQDAEVTLMAIRLTRHVCLKHEQNRQNLVKAGILRHLTGAISNHGADPDVVREACSALRIMTFDDDIRVPFGQSHDHAKMIVMENGGLKLLIEAAKVFTDNTGVLSELCATVSRLCVRNEFCQDVVDLGGLNFMVALLADCIDHQELVKQVLSAFRAIAGNDDVKDAIVSSGGTDLIVLAMSRHLSNAQVCDQGCAALAMLALRKPENCKVIMEGGGALTALQAMKIHPKDANVQKQACMVIRNLVSRSQDFSQPILEMGAESLILKARNTHKDCDDIAKAALRDLGCKVELRELWTGQKGNIVH